MMKREDKMDSKNVLSKSPDESKSKDNNGNNNNNNPEDKFKKFEGDGVTIKAKLVGTELVMEPRGDKMCQDSISRLKAIIKGQKSHKRRIVMKINYAGVKIHDEKTNEILHQHEVPQISFIASDDTDSRTFGYVCDVPNKAHQFICFKTGGPAIQVMSVISSLFEAVLEQKKKRETNSNSSQTSNSSTPIAKATPDGGANSNNKPCAIPDTAADRKDSGASSANNSPAASGNAKLFDLFGSSTADDPFNLSDIKPLSSNLAGSGHNLSGISLGSSGGGGGGINLNNNFNQTNTNNTQQPHQPYHRFNNVNSASKAINIAQPNSKQQHHHQPLQTQQHSTSFFDDKDPFGDSAIGLKTSKSIDYVCDQFGDLVLGGNNYSSVSLNDTASGLPRQSSFTATTLTNNSASFHNYNDSCTDKYAVFNDIDNLPSIFESTSSLNSSTARTRLPPNHNTNLTTTADSLGSAGGLNFNPPRGPPPPLVPSTAAAAAAAAAATKAAAQAALTRQLTNPFDDDFFA